MNIYQEARKRIKDLLESENPTLILCFVLLGKLDLIFEMMEKKQPIEDKRKYNKHTEKLNPDKISTDSYAPERGVENKP